MKPTEPLRIADQLEAIANWQQDQVASQTQTGKMLHSAATWIRTLSDDNEKLRSEIDGLRSRPTLEPDR